LHPEVRISYDPVGSGHGIARTLAGTVDFGASNGPLTDAQIQHAPKKIVHVPVVLGAGTTYIWSDYLSKVSDDWRKRVGRGTAVAFPIGMGAQFNKGVRDVIKEKPYSIGYLETTYAMEGQIASGLVQNATGNFIQADSGTITTAAAATGTNMPDDFRVSITNTAASDAYPISSFTWLLVPEHIPDTAKRQAITGFIRWVLTDGQQFANALHYSALHGEVASRVQKAVDRIQ
jgi:phosphate transport system substrate-binding protein